jgi:two-component system chemotaxis sensor kinase CheA
LSGSKTDLFREMFFEEARELLATLEEGPGDLATAGADPARFNPLYRAAHSLKGAAAMVGFGAISERAMTMEKALGQVRAGAASWTEDLARSLAAQRDELSALIAIEERQFRESTR